MKLYTAIHFLFGFIFGSIFTSLLCTLAFTRAIQEVPLEKTAERAVNDVAQAYQNVLERDDAFTLCMSQNARLKRKH